MDSGDEIRCSRPPSDDPIPVQGNDLRSQGYRLRVLSAPTTSSSHPRVLLRAPQRRRFSPSTTAWYEVVGAVETSGRHGRAQSDPAAALDRRLDPTDVGRRKPKVLRLTLTLQVDDCAAFEDEAAVQAYCDAFVKEAEFPEDTACLADQATCKK